MKDIASEFQMVGFTVQSFELYNTIQYPDEYKVTLGYIAEIRHGLRDGDDKTRFAALSLSFKVFEGDDMDVCIDDEKLFASIQCLAFFTCPVKTISSDAFIKTIKKSGAATAIPIVRARFSSACALMDMPESIKIPNIDMDKMEWHIEEIKA